MARRAARRDWLPALLALATASGAPCLAQEPGAQGPTVAALIAQLRDGEPADCRVAARILARLGPEAAPAVPALIEAIDRLEYPSCMGEALGRIGPAAIPALLEAIKGGSEAVRAECARALGAMGPKAKAALAAVRGLLEDPSRHVRYQATEAMARIAPGDPGVVEALIGLLESAEDFERGHAAKTLAAMGPPARAAIPAIIRAFDRREHAPSVDYELPPSTDVRAVAGFGPAAVPALRRGLRSGTPKVQACCAQALGLLGPAAGAAKADLIEALGSTSRAAHKHAIRALGAVAPGDAEAIKALGALRGRPVRESTFFLASLVLADMGAPAVPELVRALDGGEWDRKHAAGALARIGPDAKPAIPALIGVLRDEKQRLSSLMVRRAAQALAATGPAAAPAVARLLDDPSQKVRARAVQAFAELGADAAGTVPFVTALLGHQKPAVRAAAAEALSWIGRDARAAAPELTKGLEDEAAEVRRAAAQALAGIGPEAREAVPTLRKLLEDPAPAVRAWAVRALGSVHREPADTVPLFTAALSDVATEVQTAAAEMLARIGPDARAAAPAVARLLRTKRDEAFRKQAIAALRYMGSSDPAVLEALARAVPESEEAALALIDRGQEAKAAVPVLSTLLGERKTIRRVTRILLALGRDAAPATDALIDALLIEVDRPAGGSIDARHTNAGPVLARIGAPAVPGLVRLLGHENALVRYRALETLEAMEPGEATGAVRGMVALMTREKHACGPLACRALAKLGPKAEGAVPALIPLLRHESVETAGHAARTLGSIGAAAKAAVPALRAATKRTDRAKKWGRKHEHLDRWVAVQAHQALAAVTGEPVPHVRALLAMARETVSLSEDPKEAASARDAEREWIADALARIGGPAAAAALREALGDRHWGVRYGVAFRALREMGTLDEIPFTTVVREMGGEHDPAVARRLVWDLGPKAKTMAPALIRQLRDDELRWSAVELLRKLGPEARSAVPELVRLLRDPSASHRRTSIVETLAAIGPAAEPAVAELAKVIEDQSPRPIPRSYLHAAAFRALAAIGPAAREAVPTARKLLRGQAASRIAAIRLLGAIGPPAAGAVDDLVGVLQRAGRSYTRSESDRSLACDALGSIGPAAKRAIPALVVAEHDPRAEVRRAASEALRRVREQ